MEIKVKKLFEDAVIPTRGHHDDTGLDVTPIRIVKQIDSRTLLLGTGIAVKPPEGYYIDLAPRSSVSKKQVMIANSFGVIDMQYRGELMIPIKLDDIMVRCEELLGEPLVQIILRKLHLPEVRVVEELDNTQRGDKGFGSTSDR